MGHDDSVTTLVIVTWNSRRHLRRLADGLPGATQGLTRWRVVVADNDSSDGTPEEVALLMPDAELIRMGRNAGYAAAINAGARRASAEDVVVVMNADLGLHPGCVNALVRALDEPGVGVACPRLLETDGSTSPSIRREPSAARAWAEAVLGGDRASRLGLSHVVSGAEVYAQARDVDWATGAMLAVSPEARRRVGDWDESFFLYSEEVDYCRRVRRSGLRVRYVPAAVADHESGPYGENVDLWRILVRNRVVDYSRHHGTAAAALFRGGVAAGELLRAPRSPAHRAGLRAAVRPGSLTPAPPEEPTEVPSEAEPPSPGVVWFAAQDWWYHNQAHSDFQLTRELARSRRVLVVNSLGLRMPRAGVSTQPWRRVVRKARSTAKLVRRPVPGLPNFHVMSPILLPLYGDRPGARLNAWLVRQQVRLAARAIGIRAEPDVGVTIPTAWPVVAPLARSSLVFNRSDLQSAFPEADGGWVEGLEQQLLEHSDRVLYVSHELMKRDHETVGDRGFFLDHGVDLDHFSPVGPVAADLAAIPAPRVGFFGGLDDYVVDLDLVRETAEALPDASIVLVGDATCSMDELAAVPNLYWLGYQPYADIPSFGRGFDVAIMPWLDNEWIRFANPIKLKEYLALGLAVVTTDYPEVEDYRDLVRVAGRRADFPGLVQEALQDRGDPEVRRRAMLAFSWRERAAALSAVTDEVRGASCAG